MDSLQKKIHIYLENKNKQIIIHNYFFAHGSTLSNFAINLVDQKSLRIRGKIKNVQLWVINMEDRDKYLINHLLRGRFYRPKQEFSERW